MSDSIARQVFEYNLEMQKKGGFNGHGPILPHDIINKYITTYSNGLPYNSAIVFQDGSELTISSNGSIYWGEEGESKSETKDHFQVELGA